MIWLNEQAARSWAKNVCGDIRARSDVEPQYRIACFDPETRASDFLHELEVHLAVRPECNGVTFTMITPSSSQKRWELRINFLPGAETQPWYIDYSTGGGFADAWFKGDGTGQQIAIAVCGIALGRGGKKM